MNVTGGGAPPLVPMFLALVVLVLAACDHGPGLVGGGPWVVSTDPPEGATGVDRSAPIRVRFDALLSPSSVDRAAVRLTSGPEQPFLEVWLDPVDDALVVRPYRGAPLVDGVPYRLRVDGVRDREGRPMDEPFELRFVTGVQSTDPGLGQATWATVAPVFASSCVDGCHDAATAAAGVILTDLESARATTIGVVAAGGSDARSLRGLDGLERVVPASPGQSYLLYKMLADPHVWGDPMPPEGLLGRPQIALVADWILGGAR